MFCCNFSSGSYCSVRTSIRWRRVLLWQRWRLFTHDVLSSKASVRLPILQTILGTLNLLRLYSGTVAEPTIIFGGFLDLLNQYTKFDQVCKTTFCVALKNQQYYLLLLPVPLLPPTTTTTATAAAAAEKNRSTSPKVFIKMTAVHYFIDCGKCRNDINNVVWIHFLLPNHRVNSNIIVLSLYSAKQRGHKLYYKLEKDAQGKCCPVQSIGLRT